MYVWARLARMAATKSRRGPYRFGDEGRLSFRCLPTDIDFNMHLNNARYMMLADVGRIDIFMRSGLIELARKRGWAPMLGGLQTVFVREIRLWKRFEVVSSIETWNGSEVIGKHRFVLDNGETAALIMTSAGVYDRDNRRFVEISDLMRQLGVDATPRAVSPEEEIFIASHKGLRTLAKSKA
ncbi:thioesterase family protein [Aminobacter sp. UC22_36]|uniref:thioesterase family protein n=1 Tax=Aminobacter sp. UC22_36 TaxID=3374549 RepID=UPI003757E552